jgi:hypothetical protein
MLLLPLTIIYLLQLITLILPYGALMLLILELKFFKDTQITYYTLFFYFILTINIIFFTNRLIN